MVTVVAGFDIGWDVILQFAVDPMEIEPVGVVG